MLTEIVKWLKKSTCFVRFEFPGSIQMLKSLSIATTVGLALAACSSGSGTSTQPSGGGASSAQSTLLGTALDTEIAVTTLVSALTNDFSLRSRDEFRKDGEFRRFRYGKPRQTFHPTRNYTVPLTLSTVNGQTTGTGTATFTGDAVEKSVTSRTFTVTDVALSNSVFGIFSTNDIGQTDLGAPRQFFEIHAYSAGIAASALPNNADYTGRFLANVISDGGTGATQIDLPANLNVNFLGGLMTGTIGTVAAPDMSLSGTVSGDAMSGTAVVNSGALGLSVGATGSYQGSFFGAGAVEGAGTQKLIVGLPLPRRSVMLGCNWRI